jgi:pimeloyl-ACP methyl ester carboxylesterase
MANEPTTESGLAVPRTSVHRIGADGVTVFYRQAGPADAPVVLLLHGFPTSSFQFRELIPRLADRGDPGRSLGRSLFLDYANNVKLYPSFQEYFRKAKPPLLAIWGKYDPYFLPPGAEAFRRDDPNAVVQLLDTGHFALETHVQEIAVAMRQFLASRSPGSRPQGGSS